MPSDAAKSRVIWPCKTAPCQCQEHRARYLADDADGFRELIEVLGPSIRKTISGVLRHWPNDVEEVEQMVYLRMARSLGKWKNDGALCHWVGMTAYNRALTQYNRIKNRREQPLADASAISDPHAPEASVEDRECIELALKNLDPEDRRVYDLRMQELRIEDIATIIGKGIGMVNVRLATVRKALSPCLGRSLESRKSVSSTRRS